MRRTGSVALTILVIVGFSVAAAVAFLYSGVYNVAADKPHRQAVEWLLETVRAQSITDRLDRVVVPPDLNNTERMERGASAYGSMCQKCHLAPDIEPTPLHLGLNPPPPKLAEVGDYKLRPNYLFWVIKHGIKMTGMPAWGETHDDEQLWDLVAFVQKLPALNYQEYSSLVANDSGAPNNLGTHSGSDEANSGHGHAHQH